MSSDKQYPFLSNEKKVCGFVKKAFRYKPFVCRRRSSRPIDYRRLSLLYTALEVSSSFGHSWYLYQRILEAHRPMDSRSFVHYSFPRNPCIHGAIHIVSTHDIVYFFTPPPCTQSYAFVVSPYCVNPPFLGNLPFSHSPFWSPEERNCDLRIHSRPSVRPIFLDLRIRS